MEVDGSSHPKKKPFYKIEDPGPLLLTSLSNSSTIKSEIGTPILRVNMFQKTL